MPQLKCENCGLGYQQHALARQIALSTGVACPRCRGALRPHQIEADPEAGDSIAATRSAHHRHATSAPLNECANSRESESSWPVTLRAPRRCASRRPATAKSDVDPPELHRRRRSQL